MEYSIVIPAEAGIHKVSKRLDSRLRGNDNRGAGNDNRGTGMTEMERRNDVWSVFFNKGLFG
jgi:hypothetical protein